MRSHTTRLTRIPLLYKIRLTWDENISIWTETTGAAWASELTFQTSRIHSSYKFKLRWRSKTRSSFVGAWRCSSEELVPFYKLAKLKWSFKTLTLMGTVQYNTRNFKTNWRSCMTLGICLSSVKPVSEVTEEEMQDCLKKKKLENGQIQEATKELRKSKRQPPKFRKSSYPAQVSEIESPIWKWAENRPTLVI